MWAWAMAACVRHWPCRNFGACCQGLLGLNNFLPTNGFSVLNHQKFSTFSRGAESNRVKEVTTPCLCPERRLQVRRKLFGPAFPTLPMSGWGVLRRFLDLPPGFRPEPSPAVPRAAAGLGANGMEAPSFFFPHGFEQLENTCR